jgi:hypothetical protein
MAFKMKGSPMLYGTGKHKSALKNVNTDKDSIDNNRHHPARTKDTVDPADIKRREKKDTSKRLLTDEEARAKRVKNLYKSKSPAKKKEEEVGKSTKYIKNPAYKEYEKKRKAHRDRGGDDASFSATAPEKYIKAAKSAVKKKGCKKKY